jgi:hypothetical protein
MVIPITDRSRYPQPRLRRTPSLPSRRQSVLTGPIKPPDRWTGKWDESPYDHNEDTLYLNPFTAKDYSKPHIETIFGSYELDEFKPSSKRTGAVVDISMSIDINKTGKRMSRASTVIQGLKLLDGDFKLIRSDTDEHEDTWSTFVTKGGNSVMEERPDTPDASTGNASRPATGNLPTTGRIPKMDNLPTTSNLPKLTPAKKQKSRKGSSSTGRSKTKRFFASIKRIFRSKSSKTSNDQRPTGPSGALTIRESQTPIDPKTTTPARPITPQNPSYPMTLVGLIDTPLRQEMPVPFPTFRASKAFSAASAGAGPSGSGNQEEEPPVMIRERPPPKYYFNEKQYHRWQASEEAEKKAKIQGFLDDNFPLMWAMEVDTWNEEEDFEIPITKEQSVYIERILRSAELKYSWGRSKLAGYNPDLLAKVEGSFRLDKGKEVTLKSDADVAEWSHIMSPLDL